MLMKVATQVHSYFNSPALVLSAELCAQCERKIRSAYDGACQTGQRVKQERKWQKELANQVNLSSC